ncbi:MAG: penicillin acylase family protein, partial [Candidatus Marinimicrobia bacterium]|nr:penicillin acylase family protein [Candidatus Neomarinimicrobiota bacterium]
LKYILIIVGILILLTILTIKLYFYYDVPEYNGKHSLLELRDTVEVFTDSYGVPHIFAKSNEDLFFTAGYIIARERLFQLSLLAAVARGEISSLLGDDYAEHDDYIKQNQLFYRNNKNPSAINYDNELLIQAYCSGINTWIDEAEEKLPISFIILNTKPPKWTLSDVINVVSMMTNNIYKDRQAEWFLNTTGQYFGETKLREILAIDAFDWMNKNEYFTIDSISQINLTLENQIWELIGATGSMSQGEAMIIPKEKTALQKQILIFNDIWGMQQPAKWYDIHLSGGDINIEGAMIPGFPIPLVGKNDNTAWAFTGQVTAETINTIFDIANGEFNLNRVNNLDLSLSYIDTSGFYINPKEPSQRFKLLENRLGDLDNINVDDVVNILAEPQSSRKAEFALKVAKIYSDNNQTNKTSMGMLYEWNGDGPATSAEALLINNIYIKLLENLFQDEFSLVGENVFDTFVSLPFIAENSINMMLNNTESGWIDDIKTVGYEESLVEMVTKSIDEALVEIEKDFGKNILNGQSGKANTKTYKHILSERSFVAKLFNLNIGPSVGSYDQISSTALSRIFDLSDMAISYSILPTGQAGLPKSVHYNDQVALFESGEFRKIDFDETTIRNSDQYQKLVLCPAE